jgi:hypothetical protein
MTKELALQYGLSESQMSRVRRGLRWAKLDNREGGLMATQRCMDCGEWVKHNQLGSYREVKGFELLRAKGGGNAIAFRQETGGVLCGPCGEQRKVRDKHGVTANQTALI